jgi:hypothetical protein
MSRYSPSFLNKVSNWIGSLGGLKTAAKGSVVEAINEHDDKLGNLSGYVSIKKYNYDLIQALANENYIIIDGIVPPQVTRTLTNADLQGKSIVGIGRKLSTIKFTGNIDCFNFDAVTNFSLDKVAIEVDTTNTSDVFKFVPSAGNIHDVNISMSNDVEIRCPNYDTGGQYTGVHITANTVGVYKNNFGMIECHYANRGFIIDSVSPTSGASWANSNRFYNPTVRGYKTIGIGIQMSQDQNIMIADNVFISPAVYDFVNTNAVRKGYIIDGQFNTFIAPAYYNDSGDFSTNNIGLYFVERNAMNNNTIQGGHIEGYVVNKHMLVANNCSFMYAPAGKAWWFKTTSKIQNVLRNPDFRDGTKFHDVYNGTATVAQDVTPTGRKLTVTSTAVNCDVISLVLNKNSNTVGRKCVFIVSFKSSATVNLLIDEGTENVQIGFAPDATATGYRTVMISKTINVNNSTLACTVRLPDSGTSVDIAFMYSMIVDDTNNDFELDVQDVGYGQTKSGGTFTLPSGTTIAVNHDLGYTPDITELLVMSTSTLGAAKHWWIENITATSFNISIDVEAGGGVTFAWRVIPRG